MSKRSIFDKLAIAVVVCVAFIQAMQQALKEAPNLTSAVPALQISGTWSYVSVALLIFGFGIWLFGRLTSRRSGSLKLESEIKNPVDRLATEQETKKGDARRADFLLSATRALTNPGPAKSIADSWFMVADMVDDLGRAYGFEPPRRNSPVVQIHLVGKGIMPTTLGETINSLHRLRDGALAHPEAVTASHAAAYDGVAKSAIGSLEALLPVKAR